MQYITQIDITPTRRAGVYEFKPPAYNEAFLADFRRHIGKQFRVWHEFRHTWQVRPLDEGHLKLMADLLEKHFGIAVVIAAPEPEDVAICDCCGSYPEEVTL